jgi:excisionase family DNA binding protein
MKDKNYLTSGDVAKLCGVSKVTVLRWVEKGDLQSVRLPASNDLRKGHNRINKDDYNKFAEKYKLPIV